MRFLLSRVGINRKSKEPFKTQNAPYQKRETVQIGQIALPIETHWGTDDGDFGWYGTKRTDGKRNIRDRKNVTTVRSGELRGNGLFTPRGFVCPARR